MLSWRNTFVAGMAAISFGVAEAAYIVDTGPGTAGAVELVLSNQGISFQNLGMTFNVAQASSITSVEGWIDTSSGGNVLFELHNGATPAGTVLFSSLVAIISGMTSDWRGATGLDWDVSAGDYTLTLTPESGYGGGMAVSPPSPAGTEWFENQLSGGWATTTFNVGWRIGAESAAVPEPGSLALFGLGLAGFAAARRRKH